MYLEKIEIKKFRVLENMEGNNAIHFQPPGGVTADPETGNVVNVIAGVNGTGKTTLLECIRDTNTRVQTHPLSLNTMMPSSKAVLMDSAGEKIKVIQNDDVEQHSRYLNSGEFLKKQKDNKEKIAFAMEWNCPEMMKLSNAAKNKFVEDFVLYEDKIIYFEFAWFVKSLQAGSRNNVLEYVEKTIVAFVLDVERKSDKPMLARTAEAIEAFNKIFEGVIINTKLKSINREGINYKVVFSGIDGCDLSLKELSDGEKSLYLTVGSLMAMNPTNRVIIFDEPEVAMHPAWQQKITQVFSRIGQSNQFIVATHSPQIIANTPYQNLILLKKYNDKIIPYYPNRPPIGTDVNSILSDLMGINGEYPEDIMELHRKYRQFVKDGKEDLQDAITIKKKLLEKESNDSRFMQEMRILQRLRGMK